MELRSKLVTAVFPEFHRVASFMVYALYPTTFYQSGLYAQLKKRCRVKSIATQWCSGKHENVDTHIMMTQHALIYCLNYLEKEIF